MRSFCKRPRIALFDMYNKERLPGLEICKKELTLTIRSCKTEDRAYFHIIKKKLKRQYSVKPVFIIYNGGTDPFSRRSTRNAFLNLRGVFERDEFVFGEALTVIFQFLWFSLVDTIQRKVLTP